MGAKQIIIASALLALSSSVNATVFEFHFTGQYTLLGMDGSFVDQQAIASTLTYDDSSGTGFSGELSINDFITLGSAATIYDLTLQHQTGTNLIVGNMLVDWNNNNGLPLSMVWDATGLFNAIDYGLQAGDVISGTNLKRNGVVVANVGSATPASDGIYNLNTGQFLNQGPAPLAMTTWNTTTLCTPGVDCIGNALSGGGPFIDDSISGSPLIEIPFPGLNVNFDIGSGNSLTVLSVSSVPVPAAVWLFGSGLIGLLGFARRR